MTSPTGLRIGALAYVFAAILATAAPREAKQAPPGVHGYTEEALKRLSQVFGIGKVPDLHSHRTAPEYMLELYRSVAYSDGISRRANPYDADVVRGFPDRAGRHQTRYYFNVSFVHKTEDVLAAEFRIFKLKPDHGGGHVIRRRAVSNAHVVLLQLYEVLSEKWQTDPDSLRLLDQRRINAHPAGWQVFTVTETVRSWVNNSQRNLGFLVTASAPDGASVNGSYIRFAQRSQHHDSKQPILVVFSGDMNTRYVLSSNKDTWPIVKRPENGSKPSAANDLESIRKSYIRYLNEEYRAKHGGAFPYDRYKAYMTSTEHDRLVEESRRARLVHDDRRRRRRRRKTRDRPRRAVDYFRPSRRKHKACQRGELYVDFAAIGWSGWIISPKGYNAYHCWGECPFPLGQYYRPTNHATVQSIVYTMRIDKNVRLPCCVPDKLYSISLLYFDDEENVILKQYDEMVAASCGCH